NFSNQSYLKYKLVVPRLGIYHEIFNSYSPTAVNAGDLLPIKNEDNEYYLEIKVPPLSGIFFKGNFKR
ncbi:MAG: alpha amylase C-terminal domain-containing protein, partial [Fusobacteriaceae bacterium]